MSRVEEICREVSGHYRHWDKVADLIDQNIDMMLNYRQSGHPGGSRSKVHAFVATLLGDVMRWDPRRPEKRFGDRFVLVAGHTAPLVYGTLPVLNEALRVKHAQTGDPRYAIADEAERALYWEHLLGFRRHGGLPGHAEMEGNTLFFKFNTGPSGHGSPAAAGQAVALKRAGASGVRVFAFEGEGGLTTGASHETKNSAWGLGLDNLVYVVDWNDFGIDEHTVSSVVPGTPEDWFRPYGWRVLGTEHGSDFAHVHPILVDAVHGENPGVPTVVWVKTRKGRGYLKYDEKSHGSPHSPPNCELYWETKRPFAEKYGVDFEGFGQPAPKDPAEFRKQVETNLRKVAEVLHRDQELVDYLAATLTRIGDSVPTEVPAYRLNARRTPIGDPKLTDFRSYPESIWAKPGEKQPNRAALSKWGAWVNTHCRKEYGRPLFLAMSADLAGSTNIAGFADGWDGNPGWGWYDRSKNPEGALLPQEITEFTNAGVTVGIASVNLAEKPYEEFDGFYAACSTYGSFSYLKYGPMRLFSQLAQDCPIKVGKVLWIAGHSGPETADDSRTHFGIFEPGVTQLFPDGRVCDLHPWEYNEVPVVLAAALASPAPIVALHLTRPPVTIPDRAALGMGHHFEAARGAYLIRDYKAGQKPMGCILVQGTMTTANVVSLLPELDRAGLNVKLVAAVSPQLFAWQDAEYRERILPIADRIDATYISNRSRRLMHDWTLHRICDEYAMTSDYDDRWRTGGTLDEVIEEAHLSPPHLLAGIERFVRERAKRLGSLRAMLEAAERR
jgi:transketolase